MRVYKEYQTRKKVVVAHDIGDADCQSDWEDSIDSCDGLPSPQSSVIILE